MRPTLLSTSSTAQLSGMPSPTPSTPQLTPLSPTERLRLIALYILYKDGLLEGDITKLMLHSGLRRPDESVIRSLERLGARVTKPLKDPNPNRIRGRKPIHSPNPDDDEGNDFSRYATGIKQLLEEHVKGTLDTQLFPYTKPELVPSLTGNSTDSGSQASLRSAKPTWARSRLSVVEPRQRVIVFIAGGATFSEARACYEISKASLRDVFLGSSHMLTPNTFLTQLANLKAKRSTLLLPDDAPKKVMPAHLRDPDPVPKPAPAPARPAAVPTPPPAAAAAAAKPPQSGMKVIHQPNRPYYEEEKKKKKKKFGVF